MKAVLEAEVLVLSFEHGFCLREQEPFAPAYHRRQLHQQLAKQLQQAVKRVH